MEDLARRGFTGVLHAFSENDLNYYRDQMRRIVEVSHGVGLEVQVNPWAAGGEDLWTWGYEACGHMDHLGTREPEEVWAALTEDLTSDAHPAKGA